MGPWLGGAVVSMTEITLQLRVAGANSLHVTRASCWVTVQHLDLPRTKRIPCIPLEELDGRTVNGRFWIRSGSLELQLLWLQTFWFQVHWIKPV